MPHERRAISAAAEVQRRLWGTDPRAWADLAEAHNRPLFEAVLDAAGVGPGTRVLDVGCGSGLTLVLAAERGATPSRPGHQPRPARHSPRPAPRRRPARRRHGVPAVRRRRVRRGGRRQRVPVRRATRDGRCAKRPASPVPDGRVVASLFAAPERSQGTVVHEAMSALIPPERAADHAPYALSAPGNLEAALADAGLHIVDHGEVVCPGATPRWTTPYAPCCAPRAAPGPSRRRASTRSATSCGAPSRSSRTRRPAWSPCEHVPLGRARR